MSEELEALKRRVAELEAKLGIEQPPAPKPFVPPPPRPYYDPTEAMSPPIRLTGREVYKKQSLAEANAEFRQAINPVGTLRPLAEFLSGGPSADPAPAAVATTVPLGPPRDIKYVDAIALGFAERERREALAQQLDVERKLKGR
jgi:hypothetical protein